MIFGTNDTRDGRVARDVAPIGHVALIGCGPGDPELLTLKAASRIARAEVLIVDRLVDARVLIHAAADAERVLVGKWPGGPATPQDEINALLLRAARAGKQVARLKGGDPFVFGRAAEELAALEAAGIPYEVVPGITAAHGCAASVRLPVTARRWHRSFSLLTGATADGTLDHDWTALARAGEAFAVYMGVKSAPLIRERLLGAGADPAMPVVIVENGTLESERAFATTLSDVALCMTTHSLTGPAVLFFGLDWDEVGLRAPERVARFDRSNVVPFDAAGARGAAGTRKAV